MSNPGSDSNDSGEASGVADATTEGGPLGPQINPEALVDEAPVRSGAAFPVVGVGASAGGLEALTQLLRALPVNTGMGFVIVQHLAPGHASSLAEILSRATKMPVSEVRDEPEVLPDHVYVIPPGRDMIISGGKLRLLPQDRQTQRRGIDQFFTSLARDSGHRAIGVVLSGALNDGTLGLEAIKAEAGITFAQNDSAQHDSMPRSAVASGCVDFVLSPEKIAAELARIARHPAVAPDPGAADELVPGHARIAQIMQRTTGVDFTHYKANTLHRRITRRMVLQKMENLADYETFLKRAPDEVEALFQDILIGVSSFFRDPAAFDALSETVLPKLLAGRSHQAPVRVWTLGCSTGEEAYSLAMLFAECTEAAGSDALVQIFATDLNNVSVGKARAGLYPKSIAQDVSPERLHRFFTEEATGYRICKAIRERCIFSRHNVLDDPPFSRVDLISCRNMLIYMEPVLQQQIMTLLHYALKPGGYLWLGASETAGTSRALFELEDARHKLFTRRTGASPPGMRFRAAPGGAAGDPRLPPPAALPEAPRADLNKEAERVLLKKFAPPGVVISAGMEIVQFRGDTSAYLAPAAGAASLHLLKMLREGLMLGVRAAVMRAGDEGRSVREEGLRVRTESGFRELAVEVIPLKAGAAKEGGFLVLFEDVRTPETQARTGGDAGGAQAVVQQQAASVRDEAARLAQELAATHEYLQSVIEQQEAVNEELQSANEEAQSANEELQSVNEELETSKEEIQSSNEEMATINDELNNRNLELSALNGTLKLSRDYAQSIVASLRSPLLVLDSGLRVKTASAAFYETFHVAPAATEGRLVYDLGNRQWNIPALRVLLEDLLPRKNRITDYEVRHTFEQIGARTMVLNAQRLAADAGHEPLIILAIEDITDRALAEAALLESEKRFRSTFENAAVGIAHVAPDGAWLRVNETLSATLGYSAGDLLKKTFQDITHPDDLDADVAHVADLLAGRTDTYDMEKRYIRKDGTMVWANLTVSCVRAAGGAVNHFIAVVEDITARKAAETLLRESAAKLQLGVSIAGVGLGTIDEASDTITLDETMAALFMLPAGTPISRREVYARCHPEDAARFLTGIAGARDPAGKGLMALDIRIVRPDGSIRWVSARKQVEFATSSAEGTKRVTSALIAVRDITQRIERIEALRESELFSRLILEASPDCIKTVDREGRLEFINANGCAQMEIDDFGTVEGTQWCSLWPAQGEQLVNKAIASALGGVETRFEAECPTLKGTSKWWDVVVSPIVDTRGRVIRIITASRDITRRKMSDDLLSESQARLRYAANAAGLTYIELDYVRGEIRTAENFAAVMGFAIPLQEDIASARGPRLLMDHVILHDRLRVAAALQEFMDGKPAGKIDYWVLGDDQIERCIESVWAAESSPAGKLLRAFATNLDITARKRSEEHTRLLMGEINHRAKNLLSVVQAVARRTARGGDAATFVARLSQRIEGLAASQDLLVLNQWKGVDVADLVKAQLAYFKDLLGTRVLIDGRPARLTAAAAQGIGMALHELATNAAKYGALSTNNGRVRISWQVTGDATPMFAMSWLEQGGPQVTVPASTGFGHIVMGRMVEAAVQGKVEIAFEQGGLCWRLIAAVSNTFELAAGLESGPAP